METNCFHPSKEGFKAEAEREEAEAAAGFHPSKEGFKVLYEMAEQADETRFPSL